MNTMDYEYVGTVLLATMRTRSSEAGFTEDWLGTPTYWSSFDWSSFDWSSFDWSSFDNETNQRLVEEAGLRILIAREETAVEFGDPITFLWTVASLDSCAKASAGARK